jgi:hypothetical protein
MAENDRRPIMAGNWKMHHTHLEAIQVVQKLSYRLEDRDYRECEIVVCPAFTALRSVQTVLESDRIPMRLGAQNVHWKDAGAFTGEVSPPMLAKLNVSYVIVGHSERRQLFGETDEMVNQKLKAVLKHEMTPIVCVGETLEERPDRRAGRQSDPGRVRGRPIPRGESHRPRVRTDLGNRDGPERHAGRRERHHCRHPRDAPGSVQRRDRGGDPDPLRRQREARQHRRPHGDARDRRCPRRRRLARSGRVLTGYTIPCLIRL